MDDIEMNEYMVMNLGSKRNKEQRTKNKKNKQRTVSFTFFYNFVLCF